MGAYTTKPTEHDDQGRSDEPDFAATSVLGPKLVNRVADPDLDGVASPDGAFSGLGGRVIAPGCTDDSGRQPSGLCGLWTVGAGTSTSDGRWRPGVVPPGVVGVQGMSGNAAPGGLNRDKRTAIRFFDAVQTVQASTVPSLFTYVDLNHKLDDTGARRALAGSDPGFGNRLVPPGPAGLWAWYGRWTDKNGNGVIDSLSDFGNPCDGLLCSPLSNPVASPPDGSPVLPHDEFVWYGNCIKYTAGAFNPKSVKGGYCALDTEAAAGGTTRIVAFLFPGNHHSGCGVQMHVSYACLAAPADLPGRQALHFACVAAGRPPGCLGAWPGLQNADDLRTLDHFDEQAYGDPLLGPQDSVAYDGEFNDRTGEPWLDYRQWLYGLDWQTHFYDQSVLSSLTQVTGVGCPPDRALRTRVVVELCRFLDVDRFGTLNPFAESLLRATVQPAVRGAWLRTLEAWTPIQGSIDALRFHRALSTASILGPVDDAAVEPGWSREPNDPGDRYPGAVHGACADGTATHHGWCNQYGSHAASPRAFGDLQLVRTPFFYEGPYVYNSPEAVPYGGESADGLLLRVPGDHRRTLGPGRYVASAMFGLWHDKSQTWEETVLDLATLAPSTQRYVAAPDGWVGNIVNRTGTNYYKGYTDEACQTDQGAAPKPYGACHPYLDGTLANPQQMPAGEAAHAEWLGRCDQVEGGLVLRPVDGTWTVPVIADGRDYTGQQRDILLSAECSTGVNGPVTVLADVILPLGNQGETIQTILRVRVAGETVTDLDTYWGWGG